MHVLTAKKLQILLLCTLAACSYGVLHDEITSRICLEYFTVAHPPLFPTASTTVLALCWGVAATAGIGLVLGAVLAVVSQSGDAPPWPISDLVRRILLLLAGMGMAALCAGVLGYALAAAGLISFPATLAGAIPAGEHNRFMGVWFAHCSSYLTGLAGAGLVSYRIWAARGRPAVISLLPETGAAWLRALGLMAAVVCIIWFRFVRH